MPNGNSRPHLQLSSKGKFVGRVKRAVVETIRGQNGQDEADVYIGLQLDGFRKYENLSKSLPGVTVKISPPPIIATRNDIIEFDPDKDSVIKVKVNVGL